MSKAKFTPTAKPITPAPTIAEAREGGGWGEDETDFYDFADRLIREPSSTELAEWFALSSTEQEQRTADLREYRASEATAMRTARAFVDAADWAPVSLADFWDAEPVAASVGWRSDGVAMFYAGCVNMLFGESASGKTWVSLLACADVLRRGGRVVYLDAEDGPHPMAQRLKVLGVTPEHLVGLQYVRPSGWSVAGRDALSDLVGAADMVVIDAATEFLSLLGLSANTDTDVAEFMRLLPKWAAGLGPAVVVVDHIPKDQTNRSGPQGSQHKRAAVDGAAYWVEPAHMLKPGEGWSRVFLNKDKQGGVVGHVVRTAKGELFADLHAVEQGGFRLDVPMVAPEAGQTPEQREAEKIDALKVKITKALAGWTGEKPPGSRNAVLHFLREQQVSIRNADVSRALLDSLVASGHLAEGYMFVKTFTPGQAGAEAFEGDDGDAF